MPASIAVHTFGVMMRNARNKAPTMCRSLNAFRIVLRGLDRKPESDREISSNLSAAMRSASIQPAAMAKAGEALNMNLEAEAAMYMDTPIHTTTKVRWGEGFLGILRAAQTRPMMASQNVTAPNDSTRLENPGAAASEMVEYSLLFTRYPCPEMMASNRLGEMKYTPTRAMTMNATIAGMASVHG